MAKKQDNLLKQAIADAKAVRATALANAKLALTEAFTPKLQSMLSTKLRNEMEGDFEDEDMNNAGVGNEVDPTLEKEEVDVTAAAGSDPEAKKAGVVGAESGGQGLETQGKQSLKLTEDDEEEFPGAEGEEVVPEGEEIPGEEGDEELEVDPTVVPEGEEIPGEEGGVVAPEEDDMELEAIIKELEAEEEPVVAEPFTGGEEVPGEEVPGEEDEMPEEAVDVTADSGQDPEQGLAGDVGPESGSDTAVETAPTTDTDTVGTEEPELELDLESLVREIEGEMGEDDEEKEEEKAQFENLRKENFVLRKSLKEHRSVVVYLRDRLNEINLLNAKLLFSNKLFRSNGLSEGQKMRVIESIDRANTIREVKLVYATLAESLKTKGKKINESRKPVASASKAVRTSKSKTVLNEGAALAARFRQLSGSNKKISRIL